MFCDTAFRFVNDGRFLGKFLVFLARSPSISDQDGIIHTSTRFRKSILKNMKMISLGNLIHSKKYVDQILGNLDNFWYNMIIIFLIKYLLSTIVICWHIFLFSIYSSRTFILNKTYWEINLLKLLYLLCTNHFSSPLIFTMII